MIEDADVFSITTTTTCAKEGTVVDCVADAAGVAVTRPTQHRITQARARRPMFMAAFLWVGHGHIEDEAVNFLVGQVRASSIHRNRGAGDGIVLSRTVGVADVDSQVHGAWER